MRLFQKKRHRKIFAFLLALSVPGFGLVPAFAGCDGTWDCCALSGVNGVHHSPVKVKISERRPCPCDSGSPCDAVSRGIGSSFPNDMMCNGSRPGNISQPFLAIHVSFSYASIGFFRGRQEACLTAAAAQPPLLYLQNVTLRF